MPNMNRRARAAAAIAAAALLWAASARAQAPAFTGTEAAPITLLLPNVAAAPAPSWLHAGVRLTYYGASASVRGAGREWTIDPNGDFQTPDGRRWSGADRASASGQGFTHFDIVAVNPGKVAIATTTYVQLPGSAPSQAASGVLMATPGAAGDLWVSPTALKKLANSTQAGVRISRLPYKLGAESRPSVWIYTTTGRGYTLYIYEEATGVLLHYSASASGAPSPVIGADEAANSANTQLVTSTLVAKRTIALPWADDPPPSWVTSLRGLDYAGTVTTFISGAPPIGIPIATRMTVTARGPGWVRFTKQTTLGGGRGIPPSTTQADGVSGPSTLGIWISPEGLARLKPGQQLDRDTATGVTATVKGSNRGPNGKEMVIISLANPIEQTDLGYDRATGMLVYINLVQRLAPATNQTQLFLRSSQ